MLLIRRPFESARVTSEILMMSALAGGRAGLAAAGEFASGAFPKSTRCGRGRSPFYGKLASRGVPEAVIEHGV